MSRWVCLIILIACPAAAMANGAMGLGLEIFNFRYWLTYVIVTVVFEAWLIGRWMGQSWLRSLLTAICANAFTALMCPALCAVGMHQSFVGSRLNPNPFLNTIVILTVFGLISSFLEVPVWRVSHGTMDLRLASQGGYRSSVLVRSLLTHLLGVPIALLIVLIPPRPYVGTEAVTLYARRRVLISTLDNRLALLDEKGKLPTGTTLPEVWNSLPAADDAAPDLWAAAYRPIYSRFATGEEKREPFGEWNASLSGKPVQFLYDKEAIWLLRWREVDGTASGLVWHLGSVRLQHDPKALGYEAAKADQSPK